jgi:hypothetical protein
MKFAYCSCGNDYFVVRDGNYFCDNCKERMGIKVMDDTPEEANDRP